MCKECYEIEIERPYEALSELRLPPNKNREKQARADEKIGV
jgi:hypothetical protein